MTQPITQGQRLDFLIRCLLNENEEYKNREIPAGQPDKRRLLRSLMNVRPPVPASEEFLKVQDAYLQERLAERGVTEPENLTPIQPGIYLWQGDITTLAADAIVNAANSRILGCFVPCHGCIDNAIHTYAGIQLRMECARIMAGQRKEEATGKAKITKAYNLPCRYVLHTVGPVISGPLREQDCRLLAGCYSSCLELAAKNGLRSVAFCCISTGVFRFPQEKAAEIAVETVKQFLEQDNTVKQVIFNVFTDRDLELYRRQLKK